MLSIIQLKARDLCCACGGLSSWTANMRTRALYFFNFNLMF